MLVYDGLQQDLLLDQIGHARCADALGARADAGPHHPNQAHADHPGGLDGRGAGRDGPPLPDLGLGVGRSARLRQQLPRDYPVRGGRAARQERTDFVETHQMVYWKYHIAAVLSLQIVLVTFGMLGNVNDMVML